MKKSTVFLIFIFLAAIAAFVYKQQEIIDKLYSLMGNKSAESDTRTTLASITELNRNVKLKKANTTVWDIVVSGVRLALLDTLSTSLASDALVTFDTGYYFKLGENSLIVIENPDEGQKKKMIVLSLNNGVIQGKNSNNNDNGVRIKTGNLVTEVNGQASFGVRMREDKVAEVWVSQGKADVTDTKGNKEEVNINEHKQFPTDELDKEQKIIFIKNKENNTNGDINFVSTSKNKDGNEALSRSMINQMISKQRKKINNCYDKSQLSGKGNKVAVRLVIEGSGNVSSVAITNSSLGDPGVEECIKFWIKAIKFPQFKGESLSESIQFVFE